MIALRKDLKIEMNYIGKIKDKDTAFINAMYDYSNDKENFLYRLGRSGTAMCAAGEMMFHTQEELEQFNKFSEEVVKDFEAMINSIKTLKEIK